MYLRLYHECKLILTHALRSKWKRKGVGYVQDSIPSAISLSSGFSYSYNV